MRPIRLPASSLAALALGLTAVVACSSAGPDITSSPIYHPGEGTSGGGNASSGGNGESSSGAASSSSSSSGSGATSSGGTSSGATSSSSGGAASGTTISADTTWMTGQTITDNTTIAAGVTVTISPGATITVSSGVAITIDGTLTATTSTTHAMLTGTTWTGLVVATGGTLNANSLDITGASTALSVTGTAEYDVGTITGGIPFNVAVGGALTTKNATVSKATGGSAMAGTFTASYLDYDSNGYPGVEISGGSFTTTDTTFHGTSDVGSDMITSSGTGSITMLYSAITGCHCAYHFNNITSFDIENMDITGDSYGFMMYGSVTTGGTREVKNSNFTLNAAAGIDESGTNGPITVTGCYFDTADKLQLTDQEITISSPATAAVPAVGPRVQ